MSGLSIPKNRDIVRVEITIRVGDQIMKVSDQRPLFLGGDRRRWRRRIAEHVLAQAEVLGSRFGGDALAVAERPGA